MNIFTTQPQHVDDVQQLRQTAHSYFFNQNIVFEQREAEFRQGLERDYQRGVEERRKEQWETYQKSFNKIRLQFTNSDTKVEATETLDQVERQIYMELFGEQAKDAELALERQNLLDKKRLEMALTLEEQIPHPVRSVIQTMAQEVESDPSKFGGSMTWDEHVSYFNAKWKAEGFVVSEPYEMVVGNPPMKISVPGGQVAHATNLSVSSDLEPFPALTRNGLYHESQLAFLISTYPEQMGDILLSDQNFGEALNFAAELRQIWKTRSADNARDSILMLCTATLEFYHDFEVIVSDLSKEQIAEKLKQGLVDVPSEKQRSPDVMPPRQNKAVAKPVVNPLVSSKRFSVLDELERESAKLEQELKNEKILDF